MTSYQINCVVKSKGTHGHIDVVGTAQGKAFTTREAIEKIQRLEDDFRTDSTSTGKTPIVLPFRCPDCGLLTLRSRTDGEWDDNLDNLPSCLTDQTGHS